MRFNLKDLFLSLAATTLSLNIFSCGLKVGEEPKDDSKVEIKSVACLDESMAHLKLMFKGEAQDSQVAPALNCLSTTIQTFYTNVQGANKSYFTTQELVYFLNKNIITKETKLPDSMANEIMKLKVSLLGGTENQFTKAELVQLRLVVDNLTNDAVKLNKYMPMIVKKWDYSHLTPTEKDAQFKAAHLAFTAFSDKLFSYFTKVPTEYDINSAIDLIKEVMAYSDKSAQSIADVESYRNLVIAIKKNLIGEKTTKIKSGDWKFVSKALSSTLFLIQRSAYFMKVDAPDYEFAPNNNLSRYGILAEDIAADVYELLNMQDDKVITHEELVETFNVAFKTFDIKAELTLAMVKDVTLLKGAIIGDDQVTDLNAWNKYDFQLLAGQVNVLLRELGIVLATFDQMKTDETWKTNYQVFNSFETQFSQALANLIHVFQGRYDLQYVKSLIFSMKDAGLIKDTQFLDDYDKYYNIVVSAKKLVTSVGGTSVKLNDLQNLLSLAGRGYFHFLEYKNYIKPVNYKDQKFAALMLNLIPKAKVTMNEALGYNLNGFLSTEDFIETYSVLCTELEWQPILTPTSMDVLLKALWSNILINPSRRISGQILPGLNQEALDNLYYYVKLLFDGNEIGRTLLITHNYPSQIELVTTIHDQINLTKDPYSLQILKEMDAAFSGPVPLTTQNGYLKILDPTSNIYTYEDIQLSNIARVAARLITSAYSNSLDNIALIDLTSSQMTLPELQFGFNQIKSVLYEKDVINPEIADFMDRRFREANLFVSRANGDDFASYLEIHDIAIHLITGSKRAKDTHDNIYKHCLTPADLPLTRKTPIYDLCLLDAYYQFNDGFQFIPLYVAQKTVLGEAKMKEYEFNLLLAAGHVANDKQTVVLDTADNFPHVIQYIEMMFAKYDADLSGDLVRSEAMQAFPVFKNLIKKVVTGMDGGSKIKEEQYPGVFIYFLKFGKAPKTVIEKLQFMSFISNETKWVINSTRFDVGNVFQFISASTPASDPAPVPPAPVAPTP